MSSGNEISHITLEIWQANWCGSDRYPEIEIGAGYGTSHKTRSNRYTNNFGRGSILRWNPIYKSLGGIKGMRVSGQSINFRIHGKSWDDFCPKRLRIMTYDGAVYQSPEMNDWVNIIKGDKLRTAYKCANGWASCCPKKCESNKFLGVFPTTKNYCNVC